MSHRENNKHKAVFLDRDGTINEEVGYLSRSDKLRILPNAPQAIKLLKEVGFQVIVITNQSGVARGYFTEEDVNCINRKINEQIVQAGTRIDSFFYCPHHPDGVIEKYKKVCKCRKPETDLILQAAQQLNLDLKKSFFIGDKLTDIQMAEDLGARSILVLTGFGKQEKEKASTESSCKINYIAEDLLSAAQWILQQRKENE